MWSSFLSFPPYVLSNKAKNVTKTTLKTKKRTYRLTMDYWHKNKNKSQLALETVWLGHQQHWYFDLLHFYIRCHRFRSTLQGMDGHMCIKQGVSSGPPPGVFLFPFRHEKLSSILHKLSIFLLFVCLLFSSIHFPHWLSGSLCSGPEMCIVQHSHLCAVLNPLLISTNSFHNRLYFISYSHHQALYTNAVIPLGVGYFCHGVHGEIVK